MLLPVCVEPGFGMKWLGGFGGRLRSGWSGEEQRGGFPAGMWDETV